MDIAGKVFIVTGGAGGLGEGTARMLATHGGKMVVADLQVERGEAVARDIGGVFVKCDVSQEADGHAAVAAATGVGKLMGLVNCAGIAPAVKSVGKDGAHPLAVYSKVITVNLIGSFNMIRLAAEAMCKNDPEPTGERGVMISTASVAAYDGQIGQAAYAACEGGVVGMTLRIARDLARNGIRKMTIAPGIFGTPMLFSMPQEVQDALTPACPSTAARISRRTTESGAPDRHLRQRRYTVLDRAIQVAPSKRRGAACGRQTREEQRRRSRGSCFPTCAAGQARRRGRQQPDQNW